MRFFLILFAASIAACGGSGSATPPASNSPSVVAIYDIQGPGDTSALVGQSVTIEGIVVGDFQNDDADVAGNLRGFFVQSTPDNDVETSDGVFVFDGNNPAVDVATGDQVSVSGIVQEHFGETQIAASRVTVIGSGDVQATPITLPSASAIANSDGTLIGDLERYEGMLVRIAQTLTVSGLYTLERFGEVTLAADGRQIQFTNQGNPDVSVYSAYRESVATRRLVLDDGVLLENTMPIRYLHAGSDSDYSIRIGDQVTELTGVLRYSRGSGANGTETYRLIPTVGPQFDNINTRPAVPTIGGTLRVAGFNVLNLFSGIDTGNPTCGPLGNANCRGADSEAELERQLQKTVTAISMMNADIVGLMELENNASASTELLVNALNASPGADTYDYIATGTIGDDAIKTGFIYKTATVTPAGSFAILDSSADARYNDDKNRPSLAQTFAQSTNGAKLTVVVNHFKSKGSDCDSEGDPNVGDGQGNCNVTRTGAATVLAEWLATDPTNSGDADTLIIGDLNAYMLEDPVVALRDAGYINLADSRTGPATYSSSHDAQSGAIDHALATASLAPQIADFLIWHINADEPSALDYNLEYGRDSSLFNGTTPYRSSDHDPVIVGLELNP